jgi:hypothetical protein
VLAQAAHDAGFLEAAAFCELTQLSVPAVQSFAVGIAPDDDRLGVIEQHMLGHAAEVVEYFAQPGAQGGHILARTGYEFHVSGTAVSHPCHQRIKGSRPRRT